MVYFAAKNTGDAKASARLFNTEIGVLAQPVRAAPNLPELSLKSPH